jgi:hypothetical protein
MAVHVLERALGGWFCARSILSTSLMTGALASAAQGAPGWRQNSSVSGICEADAAARVTNDCDVSRLARLSSNY